MDPTRVYVGFPHMRCELHCWKMGVGGGVVVEHEKVLKNGSPIHSFIYKTRTRKKEERNIHSLRTYVILYALE